ncbi:FecCD family ABC transporter permease (plasmid) [Streptomyces sp. BI20]|uniref:FecCD family ABC transporter permease n=1 Tax=Streptomyces sp. BI20 TaxID=3403460 RepID=UPI003C768F8B
MTPSHPTPGPGAVSARPPAPSGPSASPTAPAPTAPARPGGRAAALRVLGLVVLAGVLLLAVWASVMVGSGRVAASDVLPALLDPDHADKAHLILREVRFPRTAAGVLAGVALGLAGTVMQGIARNPLADPGILGVNAGASAAVVFAIAVLGMTNPSHYIWFGFLGALAASLLVFCVGSLGRGGATPVKLALTGAATSAALLSLTTAMLLTDAASFDQYRFWQVGSLTGREPDVLWQALPFVVVGSVLALALGSRLNALALGDDLARALGQHVGRTRALCAAVVVLLCGAATVVAGPIAFLGLVVPHAARLCVGPDHRWVLPYSALMSPVLLLVADLVGRTVARPGEVQAGVVTAVIGAVPFVLLVRRRKAAGL